MHRTLRLQIARRVVSGRGTSNARVELRPPVLLVSEDEVKEKRLLKVAGRVEEIGRLDCVSHAFHGPVVEEALRLRAAECGHAAAAALPEGEASWTQMLCWDERRRRYGERAVAAGGMYHSLLIEGGGRLLTCGSETLDGGRPCAPPRRQTLAPRARA